MALAVATASAIIVGRGGAQVIIRQGDAWDADDPIVVAHPDMFSVDAKHARSTGAAEQAPVEDKTARPGRKATVKPRA